MSQTQFTSTKDELVARLIPFLQEVKDMTTSTDVEHWLNTKYGVESELYKELSRLITLGVQEGWAADVEIAVHIGHLRSAAEQGHGIATKCALEREVVDPICDALVERVLACKVVVAHIEIELRARL
jgi:hypothetical protein